jgi:hypothetical protein
MKHVLAALAACLLVLASALPALADDFSQGNGAGAAANWKVYSLSSSGQTYTTKPATVSAAGVGFAFTSAPDTRLFMTTHPGDLLGDLRDKTITATFQIVGDAGSTYSGTSQGLPPSVRLYFEGNTNGPFTYDTAGYSKYWWSNPESATLAAGTITLTATVTPALWSDWGGQLGSDVGDAFEAAAAHVSGIGLSFGGGSFFANGVGADGTASFVLESYSVS